MHDDRYLRLQALYTAAGRYNVTGTGTLAYAVGLPGEGQPMVARDDFGVVPVSETVDADAVLASVLSFGAVPGITNVASIAGFGKDFGYGVDYQRGTRTVTHTVGGVTHVLTFNLSMGGMVQSWTRSGVELLNYNASGRRGLQATMHWTDAYVGELFQHTAVQGGDTYATGVTRQRGGIVTGFSETTTGSSKTVVVDYIPIELDPDGRYSVPFVRADHFGGAHRPVYWTSTPMRLTIEIGNGGAADRHRILVEALPSWTVQTAATDATIHIQACFNTSVFTSLVTWDGSTRTEVSAATSGVDGYQADYRGYMMDSAKLVGDDEADDTSLIAEAGIVSAAAGDANSDVAVGFGNRLAFDAKTGNRTLGDAFTGNAWRWMQNHGDSDGPDEANFIGIGYGQFLSSRIHATDVVRTIPRGREQPIRSEVFMYTGTNATNEAAFV
jgi:hypothetical protein